MATDVIIVVDADAKKAAKEVAKLRKEMTKLKDGPAAANKSIRKTKDEASGLLGKVVPIASGMAAIAAASRVMVDAWAGSRAEAERIANIIQGRQGSEQRLRQISGSEDEFNRLRLQGLTFGASTGTGARAGLDAVFAAQSTGLNTPENMGAFQAFANLGDATSGINAVATLRASFGGNAEQNINALLAASETAKFDLNDLANAAATAGKDLQGSGIDLPTFLGAIATEQGRKSPEIVANQLKALASKHKTSGFAGSLSEWVASMGGATGVDLKPFIGDSVEARQGLEVFRQTNQGVVSSIRAGTAASGTEDSALFTRASFGVGPRERLNRLRSTENVFLEEAGQGELQREVSVAEASLARVVGGQDSFKRSVLGGFDYISSLLGGDPGGERVFSSFAVAGPGITRREVADTALDAATQAGGGGDVTGGDNIGENASARILNAIREGNRIDSDRQSATLRPGGDKNFGAGDG